MEGIPREPHELDAYDRLSLDDTEQIAAREGVDAISELLAGNAASEIVAYADSQEVDLIEVGSRGHGALASALLGSVSRGVLSESKRPVAIIRGLAASASGSGLSSIASRKHFFDRFAAQNAGAEAFQRPALLGMDVVGPPLRNE